MTIAEELGGLRADRDNIRVAIVEKGGTLPEGSPMADYPQAIEAIRSAPEPQIIPYSGKEGSSSTPKAFVAIAKAATNIEGYELDTSGVTNFGYMFRDCTNLTSVPMLDTSQGTTFNNMFYYCTNLTSVPQMDVSAGTTFYDMFYGCTSLTSVPMLDTSQGTNFTTMFRDCSNLTSVPQMDVSAGTTFNNMFAYCTNLTTVPMLDTSQGTNFTTMFAYCTNLTSVPQMDVSAGETFDSMFYECTSLTQIGIHGFRYSINISPCKLDATALNAFFTQAGTSFNTSQTINITGNPGAADCDKSIATSKGWKVTG